MEKKCGNFKEVLIWKFSKIKVHPNGNFIYTFSKDTPSLYKITSLIMWGRWSQLWQPKCVIKIIDRSSSISNARENELFEVESSAAQPASQTTLSYWRLEATRRCRQAEYSDRQSRRRRRGRRLWLPRPTKQSCCCCWCCSHKVHTYDSTTATTRQPLVCRTMTMTHVCDHVAPTLRPRAPKSSHKKTK